MKEAQPQPALARRLNSFDAVLIVLGGIVGSGIFVNPSVVAQAIHTPGLIMIAWSFGGLIALIGGFIFAELAWRRPGVGGLYAYMRDAFHPAVAFCYGWTALLISQSGGMALAAITFAAYVSTFVHLSAMVVAVSVLLVFSAINCVGVREGGHTQNVIMLLKLAVIVFLIAVGVLSTPHGTAAANALEPLTTGDVLRAFGLAMIPVLYAYDGWQTASFMSGELKDPARSLPRGLVWGVIVVVVLYVAVNWTALHILGPGRLAATNTPASDIMRYAMGPIGERIIAISVAISTLGFLSNQILTSPRIYYAMAHDGLFFKQVAWLHPRTQVPIVSIALQAVVAVVITFLGIAGGTIGNGYKNIVNDVTSIDFVFFALAAVALFIFRRPGDSSASARPGIRVPGHPWSTLFFLTVSIAIIANSARETAISLLILCSGVPIYFLWHWRGAQIRRKGR